MPLEVKSSSGVHRCVVCGKLTTNPIFYKTCCMNKPVVFCSNHCVRKWIMEWMRNQEQTLKTTSRWSRSTPSTRTLRRDIM